ncbi:DHHC palmitoyltransferase-domain-containing protein [Gamsiella multidivaricata]|uniref:DHHC palmitoyltransferase-domain-containing protein n=1 Tax=Gamsiella multidivaricata TaxID=101098 RepID=UPI00221F6598|nr:DHHC palmitoyltransferase-domain-containing protein [Gamsiella multidivaricata]KAI7830723.1 DHHC palmitoyltransferase-domain-containing protein [Gamsiella multidivaricata]
MSASIPFEPIPTSDPAPDEPIATRPRRTQLSFADRVELLIDIASRRLGPILITLAFILLSLTIYCYFMVFIPFHYPRQVEGEEEASNLGYIANMIWSCYIVWGIVANYYYAVSTPPGYVLDGISTENEGSTFQDVLVEMETFTESPPTCKRCHLPKPERTHHCSVCKKCILKYDHHCPWINNCVGHFNHRYFLMFLTYLSIASVYFLYMGAGPFLFLAEYEDSENWPYPLPKGLTAFSIVLAGAIGLSVNGMGCWHWYLTLTAQTTLEQYNNGVIKEICKKKGDRFMNMYDFGIIGNLLDFFNIGRRGFYPWYTALLPIRIPPIGNGKRFLKSGRGFVLDFGQDDADVV